MLDHDGAVVASARIASRTSAGISRSVKARVERARGRERGEVRGSEIGSVGCHCSSVARLCQLVPVSMRVRSVCCLLGCLDGSSFHATLPHLPCPFVTRSREKTCDISHDIYRLHVEEAQQAWHRAELHVEGAETSRQSAQLGNLIPPNTRSHEKTHAITHDIYRLHVGGAQLA